MRDDDESAFERWCVVMCVSRLKRRLRLGLPISEMGRRTLARFGIDFVVTFIERPDSTGARWATALALLLEAGRGVAT